MTIENLNQLLAKADIDNYKLAFQTLIEQPKLFKEAYLMVMWALKHIDPVSEMEIREEMLKFKELFTNFSPTFKNKLHRCAVALNLFFIDIGWHQASNIKAALKAFEPYRATYEAILKEVLSQPYLFIVQKATTAFLFKEIYPYYQHLIKYDALKIEDKVFFIKSLVRMNIIKKTKKNLPYIEELKQQFLKDIVDYEDAYM
jgi:hypothetical protein